MAKSRTHAVRLQDLLKPEQLAQQEPKVTWVARFPPSLKIKPIRSSDHKMFLAAVANIKTQYPNLPVYIFKIEKGIE